MPKEWWEKFFQEKYLKFWEPTLTPERTRAEVKFLIDVLKLKKKDKILDLCCGQGRHAILLAKKGFDITGVDYSKYLLGVAKERTQKEKVKIQFIRQDARKLDLKDKFDVVLNLFTAFGYGSDKDNAKIIQNVAKVLKPKGKFLIDLINVVWVLENYQKEKWRVAEKVGILREENDFDIKRFIGRTKYTIFLRMVNGKQESIMSECSHILK